MSRQLPRLAGLVLGALMIALPAHVEHLNEAIVPERKQLQRRQKSRSEIRGMRNDVDASLVGQRCDVEEFGDAAHLGDRGLRMAAQLRELGLGLPIAISPSRAWHNLQQA